MIAARCEKSRQRIGRVNQDGAADRFGAALTGLNQKLSADQHRAYSKHPEDVDHTWIRVRIDADLARQKAWHQ